VHEQLLPGGRWRLCPAPLLAQLRDRAADAAVADAPLVLVPRRQLRTMNSQLRDVGPRRERAEVLLHPADADGIAGGIADGALVEVASRTGVLTGVARRDDRTGRGTVSLTHGWAAPHTGRLTSADEGIDPLTGMVWQSGLPVEVRPWTGPAAP
jgi:anaerobic selenocysteine-containing dehydrogenase